MFNSKKKIARCHGDTPSQDSIRPRRVEEVVKKTVDTEGAGQER